MMMTFRGILVLLFGGGDRIRTCGRLRDDGFQDRYLQPLGHLSGFGMAGTGRIISGNNKLLYSEFREVSIV